MTKIEDVLLEYSEGEGFDSWQELLDSYPQDGHNELIVQLAKFISIRSLLDLIAKEGDVETTPAKLFIKLRHNIELNY